MKTKSMTGAPALANSSQDLDTEPVSNDTGRKTLRPNRDGQPVQIEARILSQGPEGRDRVPFFHRKHFRSFWRLSK